MDPVILKLVFAWYLVFVFSTVLHEAAHALAALKLGDPTAYEGGQASLDPVPHISRAPFGMVVVPILTCLLWKGGWMIGWASAPYDPKWAREFPRRSAIMAAAGPAANLLLVLVAAIAIRLGVALDIFVEPAQKTLTAVTASASGLGFAHGLSMIISLLFSLNLILFVFNLIPLPPLDGSALLPLVLPDNIARRYLDLMANPMFSFLGILVAWNIFGSLLGPVFYLAVGLLYIGH